MGTQITTAIDTSRTPPQASERLQINSGLPLREAVTFQGLLDRYVSEEIELGELAHTTKEVDRSRINNHISPKWGKCLPNQ